MRTQNASIILGILLAAQSAHSAEIAYQLEAKVASRGEQARTEEPCVIAFVNREWAALGVEQTSKELLPPVKSDFKGPPRFHIETDGRLAGDCDWLDDAAWPLTRELYGLGRPHDGGDDRTEFRFGLITLQR